MLKQSRTFLDGNDVGDAPKTNEIEVSIFGTGYGESILIHTGNDNWVVIDSCLDPDSKQPLPLLYLNKLGLNPQTSIKQIVASHWHDDHIKGLCEIVRECDAAEFVCSDALKQKEFLTLVNAYGAGAMMKSSGIDEFKGILDTFIERSTRGYFASPNWAIEDKLIFKSHIDSNDESIPCEIYSLSPSNEAITRSLLEIGGLIPKTKQSKKRLVRNPNYCSIVIWIKIGKSNLLLGSDLEQTTSHGLGWTKIINSNRRPSGKASVYKVSHHGSQNGDHDDIWNELLHRNPVALLTPFVHGKTSLPTISDIERIGTKTDKAYVTSLPQSKKSSTHRSSTVNRSIREVVGSLKYLHSSIGQVRIRLNATTGNFPNDWNIEKFGDAAILETGLNNQ